VTHRYIIIPALQFRYEALREAPPCPLTPLTVGEEEGVYDKIHSLRKMSKVERGYNKGD
jgi:hypothetical protein